jgi:tRNA-2-methylthio-N6-dimethylallyladenosine synthase
VERAARKNAHELAGRTENNRWVNFAGPATLIDRFVDLTVTETRAHTLRGRLNCAAEAERPSRPYLMPVASTAS